MVGSGNRVGRPVIATACERHAAVASASIVQEQWHYYLLLLFGDNVRRGIQNAVSQVLRGCGASKEVRDAAFTSAPFGESAGVPPSQLST